MVTHGTERTSDPAEYVMMCIMAKICMRIGEVLARMRTPSYKVTAWDKTLR